MMRGRLLLLLLVAGALALTACSSGDSTGRHVASLSPGSTGTRATPSPTSDEDLALAFAACMRQHGVDMPDPNTPGDAKVQIPVRGTGATKRALTACQHYLPGGKFDPDNPQTLDQMLQLARCLRAHGIDVADPRPGNPELNLGPGQKGSPAFARALQACRRDKPTSAATSS